MSQENVELVRAICAPWARGDYSSAEWAHPEIEVVRPDGPTPGNSRGLAGMAEAYRRLGNSDKFNEHQSTAEYLQFARQD